LWSTDSATTTLSYSLHARHYATGGWGVSTALGEGVAPKLATDGAGSTLLAAAGINAAINNSSAFVVAHASTGGWGTRRFMEDVAGSAPEIAMNGAGRAMVLWNYVDGAAPATRYRLRASYFDGAAWSTPGNLDNQGTGDMLNYVIGFDDGNNATALWLQDNYSVWANRFAAP
jgi:hypothetical protein